jgi:glutathione peroxidase
MKELGERWGDQLVILAFPTREFGAQEFQKDEQIQNFANQKEFPGVLLQLGKVKGSEASEVWQYFKMQTGAADPGWNFSGKFLVDKEGKGMS